MKLPDHVVHLLTGLNADQYAAEMRGQLAAKLCSNRRNNRSATNRVAKFWKDRYPRLSIQLSTQPKLRIQRHPQGAATTSGIALATSASAVFPTLNERT